MNRFFKVVIYTPHKELFGYLHQNLVLPDLEMFYLTQIDEVESYVNRIRPNVVILYVDHESKKFQDTLKTINHIRSQQDLWLLLLNSPKLSASKLQTALPVRQVFLQKDSDDYQQVAHNLMFIRSINQTLIEQKSQHIFDRNINECLKIIYEEKNLQRILERLVNFLPKIVHKDYWAVFTMDKQMDRMEFFSRFVPPTRRNKISKSPDYGQLVGRWLIESRAFNATAKDSPELFTQLTQLGWEVKQLYYLPIQYRDRSIGGLLVGMDKDLLSAQEIRLLKEVVGFLARRILEINASRADQVEVQDFSDQLLSNEFDEESVFQYACQKLTEATKATSTVYWQYNKGFGFMFPKFWRFQSDKSTPAHHDKDMVFFNKETFLSDLINRGKLKSLDNVDSEERLSQTTRQIFRKMLYHNLLIIPIKVAGEVSGALIINKSRAQGRFTVWEIQIAEEIAKRTQHIIEDAQTVKEANLKIKQLQRIFELGGEIKLGLGLYDILTRITVNLRKALGWNDVAVLLLDEGGKELRVINRIGFSKTHDFGFEFKDVIDKDDFQKRLQRGRRISNSYFLSKQPEKDDNESLEGTRIMEWRQNDLLAVPLETRQEVMGYLIVADPVDRLKPTKEKLSPLEYYANQAAVSVENSLLYEELRSSQERYRSLAETMSMGLVTSDDRGKIIYVNPAFVQLLGHSQERLHGTPLKTFFTESSRIDLRVMIQLLLKAPDKDYVEIRELEILSKSGEEIPVNVYGFPFYERRKQTGFFLILNDLRVIKRLERMKADFNSMIVHDLRSPMNVIQGFVELIRNQVVGQVNEEQEELLDIVKENVKKVLALVDNFLVASKLEVGKFTVDLKLGEINSLVRQQVDNSRVLTKSKQIEIDMQLDNNLPMLMFDMLRIDQVLNNLLSNAIKFTPDNGKIYVKTALQRETVDDQEQMFICVSVRDTGVGIPKDKLPYVFEKYEQVEENQSFNIRGTGLGLSICKEIIELHEGRIWVESDSKTGSTFLFILPIAQSIENVV